MDSKQAKIAGLQVSKEVRRTWTDIAKEKLPTLLDIQMKLLIDQY